MRCYFGGTFDSNLKNATMSLSVLDISPATSVQWDSIWRECNYATYFHSREWAEIWEKYTKGKLVPSPLLIKFSDGCRVIVPLSKERILKGIVHTHISSPAGTYGGWISADVITENHAILLTNYLMAKVDNLIWRINPIDALAVKSEVIINKEDETHVIDLSVGFEAIHQDWTNGSFPVVRKVRKARDHGVSIRLAESEDDWLSYFQVYEESLVRWGDKATTQYSLDFFEEIYSLKSNHVNLWLALYNNKIIAGALCFYAKNHVVYWHGAALGEYFNLRPVNLILYTAIKDACTNGYLFFDFNPSGGLEGVKKFKRSFGAKSLPSNVVQTSSLMLKLISGIAKLMPCRI